MTEKNTTKMADPSFLHSLLAGGTAGLSVDLILFPLDTIKTRMQSAQGFVATGGLRGVYAGIGSVAAGSVPGAALFFCSYETVKKLIKPHMRSETKAMPLVHMLAACTGEVVACIVRVPTEVVKQRAQASRHISTMTVFRNTLSAQGLLGFYQGYWSTVIREVPFSVLQFPLWEFLKTRISEYQQTPVEPWQSSLAGAFSGGTAAAVTTPLDVAKTRIMLAEAGSVESRGNIRSTLNIIYKQNGISGLFAGLIPRVLWISVGGAIFLGVYDKLRHWLADRHTHR